MKHLLILIYLGLLLIASTVLVLCTKNSQKKTQMSFEQLSTYVGKSNAFDLFDRAGKTEANPTARGEKRVKANATLNVDFDLSLSGTPLSLTYTTSPDAYIGGVTRFPTAPGGGLTNDGAKGLWDCNRRWDYPAVAPPSVTCSDIDAPVSGEQNYRAYTSDKVTYDVHLSNLVTVTNP